MVPREALTRTIKLTCSLGPHKPNNKLRCMSTDCLSLKPKTGKYRTICKITENLNKCKKSHFLQLTNSTLLIWTNESNLMIVLTKIRFKNKIVPFLISSSATMTVRCSLTPLPLPLNITIKSRNLKIKIRSHSEIRCLRTSGLPGICLRLRTQSLRNQKILNNSCCSHNLV